MGSSISRVQNFPQGGVLSKLGGLEFKGGSALLVKIIVVVVECCCFLLLIIIVEGSGDAPDRFDSLKPSLSEAIFKLPQQNEYVPDWLFCCWDCFRTTLTHFGTFYKLDVEGDNR